MYKIPRSVFRINIREFPLPAVWLLADLKIFLLVSQKYEAILAGKKVYANFPADKNISSCDYFQTM